MKNALDIYGSQKPTETRNIHERTQKHSHSIVTTIFPRDGTDLEGVLGSNCRHHVYLKTVVERVPQVG